MQPKLTVISLLFIVILAAICSWQRQQLSETRAVVAETREALQAATNKQRTTEKKVQQLEQSRSILQNELSDVSAETAIMRASIAQSRSRPAKSATTDSIDSATALNDDEKSGDSANGMTKMIKNMMKDPAMKEMIQAQQKASTALMYGALLKDLQLSPEDKESFLALLSDTQTGALDNMDALIGNDPVAKTNAVESMKKAQKATDDKMKTLLGEEKYAQYQEYQGTMGERMQLDQFKTQMAGTDSALRDDQIKQLLQVMKEERTKNPPVFSNDQAGSAGDFSKMMSKENMEKQFQWQEDINRKVLERAGQVLSEDQAKQLKAFQEQQLNMQRLGMKMAAEMFGTNRNAGGNSLAVPK